MNGWEGWRRWGREEVWRVTQGRGGWMNWVGWINWSHHTWGARITYCPGFPKVVNFIPANLPWVNVRLFTLPSSVENAKKKMRSCYYLMFPIMWTPFYLHLRPTGSISNSTMHVSLTIGGTLRLSGPLLNGGIKFEVILISINWASRQVFLTYVLKRLARKMETFPLFLPCSHLPFFSRILALIQMNWISLLWVLVGRIPLNNTNRILPWIHNCCKPTTPTTFIVHLD